jgi:channel protein (hemolysin III family)
MDNLLLLSCQLLQAAMHFSPILALEQPLTVHSIPGIREPFSCCSHFLGAIGFTAWGVVLVRRAMGKPSHVLCVLILISSSVLLLTLSGTYHMLWPGPARDTLHQLDVAAVFLLIAGSMTPMHVILFRGFMRWGALTLIWTFAVSGIVLRLFVYTDMPLVLGTTLFVCFGWGGFVAAILLSRRYGLRFIEPFIYGGLAYTVGAVMIAVDWPVLIDGFIGPHEAWHIAVLMGLGFHWYFVAGFSGSTPTNRHLLAAQRTPSQGR